MDVPSGRELAGALRKQFPEMDAALFDDDVALFSANDGEVSACGVLSAFSWAFDRWVAAGAVEPIRRALALVEEWLAGYLSPNRDAVASRIYDSLLSCFLENILPTTPEGHPLVVPNLGPKTRSVCEASDPSWLLPNADATLAT
jgi:hypothetical protein